MKKEGRCTFLTRRWDRPCKSGIVYLVSVSNISEEDDLPLPAWHYPPLRHLPAALRGGKGGTKGPIDE